MNVAGDEVRLLPPDDRPAQHLDRGDHRTLDHALAQFDQRMQSGRVTRLVDIGPAQRRVAEARRGGGAVQVHVDPGRRQHVAVGDAILGADRVQPVTERGDTALGEQRRQKGRGGDRPVVAVVRVGDVDHLVDRRGDRLAGIEDRLQHPAVLFGRLALHAQGDQEDAGAHRVDLARQDSLHAQTGLLFADVLRQVGPGRDPLDDGIHRLLQRGHSRGLDGVH